MCQTWWLLLLYCRAFSMNKKMGIWPTIFGAAKKSCSVEPKEPSLKQ